MSKAVQVKIPEFPGFAVRYDPTEKPFFVSQVLEDLRTIKTRPIGEDLLKKIAKAKPKYRSVSSTKSAELKACRFPSGINIVVIPTSMTFTQSGYKMDYSPGSVVKDTIVPSAAASHNIKGCPYHPAGGSCAEAGNIKGDNDGRGCVSIMKYTNAQIITGKGEVAHSFIVLAHELIHSYHHLTGTKKNTGEEIWTTGLNEYANEPMSENAFRSAFGLPPRQEY